MKVKYSQKTIDRIREIYPERADLHELAQTGNEILVRILDELAGDIITPLDVVKAFDSSRKEEVRNLYDRARRALKKHETYELAMEDFYLTFSPEEVIEESKPHESNE